MDKIIERRAEILAIKRTTSSAGVTFIEINGKIKRIDEYGDIYIKNFIIKKEDIIKIEYIKVEKFKRRK